MTLAERILTQEFTRVKTLPPGDGNVFAIQTVRKHGLRGFRCRSEGSRRWETGAMLLSREQVEQWAAGLELADD